MNDLAERLKQAMIDDLLSQQDIDDKYLNAGNKWYTKREIASHLANETRFGIETMQGMLYLSLDMVRRSREKFKNFRKEKLHRILNK
jgi:hypothetical protein